MTDNIARKANLSSPLLLWNRTNSVTEQHCSSLGGLAVAAGLGEIARKSDIIWSCLKDDAAVLEVYDKLLESDISGKLFVESSTTPPQVSNDLAKRVTSKGAEFVSMPGMKSEATQCGLSDLKKKSLVTPV